MPSIRLHGVLLQLLFLLSAVMHRAAAQSNRGGASPEYPYGIDASFSSSITFVIVTLVCAFFFLGFFSIYLRQCAENSGGGTSRHLSRLSPLGLDASVIESFPTFLYSTVKDLKIGKGALECAICISEFEDANTLRLLPYCHHVFHPDCIDAWLASHSICPVCRVNLSPSELAGDRTEPAEFTDEQELPEIQDQRSIALEIDPPTQSRLPDMVSPKRNRKIATKKFPRSHSTGHSVVQPGESCERYTLKLPDDVKKRILRLKRTKSCIVVWPTDGSSRRGYRSGGGEGSSRGRSYQLDRVLGWSDRWVFTKTPSFVARTGSFRLPKVGADPDVKMVGASNANILLAPAKTPLDCLAGKSNGVEQSTDGLPV
ncbi:hypothetical protein RJ639_018991 [Escallonia herrerae]|uniref:RING-type E3 ubiquitin transferase n=1 Tax=Escallonia herrerae TaxID=1293975 RepID=A0AA89AGM7_9ASTE|nr:hypothetical protein RJ639_018991 [Escallonia herrerae]